MFVCTNKCHREQVSFWGMGQLSIPHSSVPSPPPPPPPLATLMYYRAIISIPNHVTTGAHFFLLSCRLLPWTQTHSNSVPGFEAYGPLDHAPLRSWPSGCTDLAQFSLHPVPNYTQQSWDQPPPPPILPSIWAHMVQRLTNRYLIGIKSSWHD